MHTKKSLRLLCLLLTLTLLLSLIGCGGGDATTATTTTQTPLPEQGTHPDLGGDATAFGASYAELGIWDGYFETPQKEFAVTCISGTPGCYAFVGDRLIFTELAADSVYAIAGQFRGTIEIDVGANRKLDLELHGVSILSDKNSPITVKSGSEVSITAKKNYRNFIYDLRNTLPADSVQHGAAIYSEVDLEIAGKGALCVVSEQNSGIGTKDDLQVKNLNLTVLCADNALKGNDSVEITYGTQTLIATRGDAIKTKNSHISTKGDQKGSVYFLGCTANLYAGGDGVDAAYDVVIADDALAPTTVNVYTDKYSAYSQKVTDIAQTYYVRYTSQSYKYSVKYYNSDTDFVWKNATYRTTVVDSTGQSYYYYALEKLPQYSKMELFLYAANGTQGQDSDYLYRTGALTPNLAYDTLGLTNQGSHIELNWSNYQTKEQAGMGSSTPATVPHTGSLSTKGIKAANAITVEGGTLSVKSYDNALHASSDEVLGNGQAPTQSIAIRGGTLTLYTNDDGMHATASLAISGGSVAIANAHEGIEAATVTVSGGNLSVLSRDDAINSPATEGTAVTISGGTLYLCAGGDGIDTNSQSSFGGIQFTGGNVLILSTSASNTAIDTAAGYAYTGGTVLALMPAQGKVSESMRCQNFSTVGATRSFSATAGQYLGATVGSLAVTVKLPLSDTYALIALGATSATATVTDTTAAALDKNGVCFATVG